MTKEYGYIDEQKHFNSDKYYAYMRKINVLPKKWIENINRDIYIKLWVVHKPICFEFRASALCTNILSIIVPHSSP